MKSLYSPRSARAPLAAGLALSALIALAGCAGRGNDAPPRCPVTHTSHGDIVHGGPRPCTLYTSGISHAQGHGGQPHDGVGDHPGAKKRKSNPKQRSGTSKRPSAPKAPAAPKPKAPPAPPKAPAAPAPKPPAPRIR